MSAGACAGGGLPRGALLDALLVAFSTQPTSECVAHALPFLWILDAQQRNLPPGSELQPTVPDTAHSPQEAAQHAPSAEMSPRRAQRLPKHTANVCRPDTRFAFLVDLGRTASQSAARE